MAGWLDKYQEGGEVFLQPNSKKLPKGYKVPLKNESSELAMSIGGEQGEPAYLIPSFKYGKPLLNPLEEYRKTGEHLGGPFKTWQEADKWEREIRHPYVEKGQPIPSPLKYWGEGFKNGGIVAQGGETISSSREIPEITVYGKKNYLQELDKQQQKYLADMAKYKQDSAEWAILNNKYKNTKKAYEDSLKLHNWTQLYKEADFNRPAFETLTNDEALDYIATTGDRNRADIEKIGFLGTPFLNPKRGTNPNDYNNYYGGVGHTWGTKDIPSKYFEDITEENKKIIELFKKQKIKPSHFINTDNPSGNDTGSLYPIYDKPKGQSPIAPTPPIKPIGTNVKYDSTYENLRMRPLWATMAKQDTTSKIGTLNPLDPLYEKGFTYGEAQKFPEEIRKQYKLDYPIYQNGGEITREDYLRQQHQDYLKSQAEKGRKAVVEGREKFAKDYVIPAIKTVGSFTPAGPLIGLADAYGAYQQGNTGWAIAGAGMEALPYVGKGIGKGVKALKNIRTINKSIKNIPKFTPVQLQFPSEIRTDFLDSIRRQTEKLEINRQLWKEASEYSNVLSSPENRARLKLLDDLYGTRLSQRIDPWINNIEKGSYVGGNKKIQVGPLSEHLSYMGVNKLTSESALLRTMEKADGINLTKRPPSIYDNTRLSEINPNIHPDDISNTAWHELSHDFNSGGDFLEESSLLRQDLRDIFHIMKEEVDPLAAKKAKNSFNYPSYTSGRIKLKNQDLPIEELIRNELKYISDPTETWSFLSTNLRQDLMKHGYIKNYLDPIDRNLLDKVRTEGKTVYSRFDPYIKNSDQFIKMFNRMGLATVPAVIGVGAAKEKFQKGGIIPKAQEGTATNPKTGERFYLTNEKGRFTPFDKRAYKTILPAEYPNEPGALKRAALSFITGKPLLGGAYDEKAISRFSKSKDYGAEMWKYALGSNDPMISVEASKYKPSDSEDPDARYFAIKDIDKQLYANRIINELGSKNKKRVHINDVPIPSEHVSHGVANYTIGKEEDEQGKYVSYYDIYDFDNPIVNSILDRKPETYDRIYYEENPFYKEYQNIEATKDSLFNTGTEENRKKATDLISNRTKIIKRANEAGYSVFDPIQVKDLQKGGNVSYTPEYIEQLKQFENKPSNLGYHLDPKKIPTIGWGHRLTAEELKKKAVRVGKEWIPYEKFSGKEGRSYADRLLDHDVTHHYERLKSQVGTDTLETLSPEVVEVLLDITYNRGSLGDSLEYVKKGDIPGLKNYLASVAAELEGGAKTRMEWRAGRIPTHTLPPVEAPLYTGEQRVPEVLDSFTQTSTQVPYAPIIEDNAGYLNPSNYGSPVRVGSNDITMRGVPFPVLGISDEGEVRIMMPGEDHRFRGSSVTEFPLAQSGVTIPSSTNNLSNFTKPKGWLDRYDESEPTLIDHQIPEVKVVADRLYPYKGCVEGTACDLSSHLKVGNEEFRKMNNFYGNAWNVLDNMYGNEINITNDYSGLNVGDVVNMSRKKFKSDIEKGIPESNQHIGRVSKIENGIPYIKHYISSDKKYYEEPINNISAFAKYDVTRAKRPDTLRDIDFNSSNLRFDENYEPNEIEQDILKVNKPELQRILRLTSENYDKLERIAYGIMGTESSFGRSKRSVYRMVLPDFVQKSIKVTHDMLRGKDVYDENINNLSQGYSSTKESSLHGVSDNTGELNYEEINKRVRDKDFTGLERTNNYLYQALQNMGLNTDNLENGSNSFKAVMATLAWLNKRFPNITEEELLKKYTGKKDISSYKEVYDSYLKNIDNNPNNNMDYSWFDEALGKTSHVANQLNNSGKKLNSMIVSKLRDSIPVPENASALFSDLLGAKEPITEKTLRKNTLDKLTNIVRNNIKKGKFTLEYNDYGTSSDKNSDVGAGKSPSISKMMNDEAYILKTLLGQATIKELGNNEYEIVDTYDFNDKGKSFGFIDDLKKRGYSPYAIVRSLGRNYGSQPNQGSQVRIKIKL